VNNFPDSKGKITAAIITGYGLGSFFFNFLCAAVVNPDKLPPSVFSADGNEAYFTAAIAENLPIMFRTLFYYLLGIAAFALLIIKDISLASSKHDVEGISFADCLKTPQFVQILLITLLSGSIGLFFIANYKRIGLNAHPDSFVTIVGSVAALSNGLFRIVWGYLLDKYSYKSVNSLILLLQILLCSSFYFIVKVDYLYLLWVGLIFCCHGGVNTMLAPVSMKLYGQNNGVNVYSFFAIGLGAGSLIIYAVQVNWVKFFHFDSFYGLLACNALTALLILSQFTEEISTEKLKAP
jgi:MFS transporter, OFA family, oxalate/formate antiporter